MLTLSLVVCTRNRAAQLGPCLDAIAHMQKPAGFELIVVDNGSTDDTQAVLQRFAAQADFRLLPVFEPVKGLGNARNCGWRNAQGAIVAFTDDDCYVEAQFAPAILDAFAANDRLGYLGGRIRLYDPTDLPLTILDLTTPRHFGAGELVPAGAIQGANFAFRRAALEATGGFDPLLGAGTPFPSEDIELVARLSTAGWQGAYTPDAVVFHHHGRKSAADEQSLNRNYDIGRGAYYAAAIMNPHSRSAYLRHWYWSIRQQGLQRTLLELRGAFGYTRARCSRKRPSAPAAKAH